VKVSLVATVKDAGPAFEGFLSSVARQTRRPDEIVVVDGGSTDGTWETLRATPGMVALSEPGANIARGRNLAIRAAAHDVIAVTDADCILSPGWLERILEPIVRGADVAAGFYRPVASSFVQTCAAAVSLPEPAELRPGWMPSSRSIAFRREAHAAVGGYPEWLDVGEDMYFDHRLVEAGVRMEPAPDAVVFWPMRETLAETWRQYSRYAEGDALAGLYPHRHLIRFGTYAITAAALVSRRPSLLAPVVVGGVAYGARPLGRAWTLIPPGSPDRLKALVGVPAMIAFVDAAKMWGYLRGLGRRAVARGHWRKRRDLT
jgi:glycosyltransferase involved in cell wall biosynthesis